MARTAREIAAQMERWLKVDEVEEITGLNRATFWRRYTADPPTFPAPVYFGETRRWAKSAIDAWIAAEIARPPRAQRRGRGLTDARIAKRAKVEAATPTEPSK